MRTRDERGPADESAAGPRQGISEIANAQDLLAFAEVLEMRGGFEATAGAMLGLQAVLRGANAVE